MNDNNINKEENKNEPNDTSPKKKTELSESKSDVKHQRGRKKTKQTPETVIKSPEITEPVLEKDLIHETVSEPVIEKDKDTESKSLENESKTEVTLESVDETIKEPEPVLENEKVQELVSESVIESNKEPEEIIENQQEKKSETEISEEQTNSEEKTEKKDEIISVDSDSKESNYQISLIDENHLRVRVTTDKSVSIDCSVKDKKPTSGDSNETQTNKILIHPKSDNLQQEVEIIVSIGAGTIKLIRGQETAHIESEVAKTTDSSTQKVKLIPNPLVANLIEKASPFNIDTEIIKGTPEEILEQKLGPKNPWKLYREAIHRNLIKGFTGAVVLYLISMIAFYTIASKKNNNADVIETPRLIIMQDIAENQLQQQNVDDPNKPKEEEKASDESTVTTNKIPPIIPKKVRPPRIIGPRQPKIETDSSTAIGKELDSLRRVNKNITGNNTLNKSDSIKRNFPFPDSLLRPLKENEVGLVGKFPPNWKQMDSRMVNINQKDFTGVLLVDTAVKKKEEAVNMSVQIDRSGEYIKQYTFKNIFSEDTLNKVTIYSIEPKQEGDQTYYRFYISGASENVYVAAFINNEYFALRKSEIEQVVSSIRIQKPAISPK